MTDNMNPYVDKTPSADNEPKPFLGLNQKRRFKCYGWLAAVIVVAGAIWAVVQIEPHRMSTYTDVDLLKKVARDVKVGYVLWKDAEPVTSGLLPDDVVSEPTLSSDGTRMVYAKIGKDKSEDLFLRQWDGTNWSAPQPMRALNSKFRETSPSVSGDGRFLYFASNRPGGRGGYDIWVSKWDGAEYAWPLPLTSRVNSRFDEMGPAISPDNSQLFFSSSRPRVRIDETERVLTDADIEKLKTDHDLYSADIATETPYELMVERQLSMLYSLREGALADTKVMAKLGGTTETEAAVDKALAYLASIQSEDGRWAMGKHGGKANADMAGTGAALLAFYGRGERHDEKCKYQEVVRKGLDWLVGQQNKVDGDLRGTSPRGDMYVHGIAALALVEAYGVTKDLKLRPRAQTAVDFVVEAQHEEGGWRYQPGQKGDLSVSGWMVMVLASAQMSGLQVKQETLDGAGKFLDSVSAGKNGGAYGYVSASKGTPAMNAVGFFCRQLLGLSNSSEMAWEASSIIDQTGLKVDDLYYAYYGTLASYQHQGPAWRRWLAAMTKNLVAAQDEDGSWLAKGAHGGSMGKIICTALATLSLEAHYRYTPLYGLGYEPNPAGPKSEADGLLPVSEIPKTPLFRHAQHIENLSSPAEDVDPVVTDHSDFLYFASGREEGLGGTDIYRSRFQDRDRDTEGESKDGGKNRVPGTPVNLGPEINSKADESAPALRMAGFHLMFNSGRENNPDALYGAMSKRVQRRFDYSKMPSGIWYTDNLAWLLGMGVALFALIFGVWYALRRPPAPIADPEAQPIKAAV